jgi:hypothetical protein
LISFSFRVSSKIIQIYDLLIFWTGRSLSRRRRGYTPFSQIPKNK